jgi:hypothetical protein
MVMVCILDNNIRWDLILNHFILSYLVDDEKTNI